MTPHALRSLARALVPLGTAVLLATGLTAPSVPAGALPATYFSDDGLQTTDVDGWEDNVNDVAIQPDGKTVAVGTVDVGSENDPHLDFGLARYDDDGSLDESFAADGIATTNVDADYDYLSAVALQADGKILVTGVIKDQLALTRYNSNGTLDTSFANGGIEQTDFGNAVATGSGVAIQSDGKIIVGGTVATTGAVTSYVVARYDTNGSVDSSFGTGGHQFTEMGDGGATAVALQADDRIVVAGSNGARDFVVVRYDRDGVIDDSFSGDGIQTTEIGEQAYAQDLGIQADGRIVVAGGSSDGSVTGFTLARYDSSGSLDTTFSDDGVQVTERAGVDTWGNALTIQSDSKIVVAGFARTNDGNGSDFALARYDTNGALDYAFSEDGVQTTDFGSYALANAVAVRPDGKMMVAGEAFGSGMDFALARYNPDGSLDAAPTSPPTDPPPSTDPEPTPASSRACTITGTARGEVIHGTSGRDVICARGGADVVYGHGGNDLVFGHAGNDRLIGGPGNDRLHGASGRDKLVGGTGSDLLRGGHQGDRLNTRDRVRGNDSAYGGYGNDSCATNRGDLRRSC